MQRSHEMEEILETLWLRTQERGEGPVARAALRPADAAILEEMKKKSLITLQDNAVGLTAKGLQEGRDEIGRAHV